MKGNILGFWLGALGHFVTTILFAKSQQFVFKKKRSTKISFEDQQLLGMSGFGGLKMRKKLPP